MASWGTVCRNSGKGGKIHVVIHCLKFINTIRKCSLNILYYENITSLLLAYKSLLNPR